MCMKMNATPYRYSVSRVFCHALLGIYVVGVLGCKPAERKLDTSDDALRVTQAQRWGEQQVARLEREHLLMYGPKVVLPADLSNPELFETTQRIYQGIESKGRTADFSAYDEEVSVAGCVLRMIPIPGGVFVMGSPEEEQGRRNDEGPQHVVRVSPFWMSAIEIPWEVYTAFMENGRPRSKEGHLLEERGDDEVWDAVAQPTSPYAAMNLGMGHGYERGLPAIAMSHYAASKFCEWLSAQTGHYYRLPTEAEWEYACRAEQKPDALAPHPASTAYTFGNDESSLDENAWYWDNSKDRYQRTMQKKPNAWGLYDMHGNVAEWVLDAYLPDAYNMRANREILNPIVLVENAPRLVRGGSWDDDPEKLRCAAREPSTPAWNMQDPQNPKSIWYLTDGGKVGFRVVRPFTVPDIITVHRYWNTSKARP